MPIVAKDAKLDYMHRQVVMSRNIVGGRPISFLMGGLNYQIEHHLFPSMPRPNLRLAQPMVKAFCRERGITYTEATLPGAYQVILAYLNRVGIRAAEADDLSAGGAAAHLTARSVGLDGAPFGQADALGIRGTEGIWLSARPHRRSGGSRCRRTPACPEAELRVSVLIGSQTLALEESVTAVDRSG